MKNFALDVPINSVSFGQTSIAIIRELFSRNIFPNIFPLNGQIDLSTQKNDDDFNGKLNVCINKALSEHSRKDTSIKLWHIVNSLPTLSKTDSRLITFYECQDLQPTELNILRNQDKIYVTTKYTQRTFENYGIKSEFIPLGFDSYNFFPLEKRPTIPGVTSFILLGKAEHRKNTYRQLNLWAKKYGNKKEFKLNCAINNPFLKPEHQSALIYQALEGKQYWNINFLPYSPTNAEFNSVLQSSDIVLACSGSEGWDLPVFHAVALGAHPVALRAHAYVEYLTDDNAVFVNPNGMIPIYDNIFFRQGSPVNQGNIFTFSDEEFYAGCEKAVNRASQGLNTKGLELQKQTYATAVDILLKDLS
jgi:hypothetical protein